MHRFISWKSFLMYFNLDLITMTAFLSHGSLKWTDCNIIKNSSWICSFHVENFKGPMTEKVHFKMKTFSLLEDKVMCAHSLKVLNTWGLIFECQVMYWTPHLHDHDLIKLYLFNQDPYTQRNFCWQSNTWSARSWIRSPLVLPVWKHNSD